MLILCLYIILSVSRKDTESVDDVISKALPTIQQEDHDNLMRHLTSIGVKTDSDLQFLTLEDLKDIVSLIAGQKLIHFLTNRGK